MTAGVRAQAVSRKGDIIDDWLIDEMYQAYQSDPNSVDDRWQSICWLWLSAIPLRVARR